MDTYGKLESLVGKRCNCGDLFHLENIAAARPNWRSLKFK